MKLLLLFLISIPTIAMARDYKLEDFPAEKTSVENTAKIDFTSNPSLKKYKTVLTEGMKEGPNFAGNFTVVSFGCGSNCAIVVVLNSSGKILHEANACAGKEYSIKSNLLILNPLDEEYSLPGCDPEYYVLKNGNIEKL